MEQKNGYFYLQMREDGVYAHLVPEKSGGAPLIIDDIIDYLNKVHIADYDIKNLHTAIVSLTEEVDVKLCPEKVLPIMEMIRINISEDRKTAVAKWYAPSSNGKVLDEQDIKSAITREGIKYGVQIGRAHV